MKIEIELTDAEYKVMGAALFNPDEYETELEAVSDWVTGFAKNKARKRMDAILMEITDKQPNKMQAVDRDAAILAADLSNYRGSMRM